MKRTLFVLLLALPVLALAQHRIAEDIRALQNSGVEFQEVTIMSHISDDLARFYGLEGLKQGTVFQPDLNLISDLLSSDKSVIRIPLPTSDRRDVTLDLMEYNILTPGFHLYASEHPDQPIPYTGGKYFRGIIHGDPESIVSLSIFNDELMGVISNSKGNFVLAKIPGSRDHLHILYNDKDLEAKPDWECAMIDDGVSYTMQQLFNNPGQRDPGDCVKVYIEIDDDIVTDKGGAINATNHITGLFNEAFTLYANENITMSISEIYAWTSSSPYSGNSASAMLNSFQALTEDFNGDIAQLVSYQASGGIAAGYNGICNSNPDLSKCFSSIDPTYELVPTYSWSAFVITHEMGHLVGSRHTHACVWNGNNTAIDGCASTEGGCPLPGIPAEGGTMMSYCHLQSVGINFNLGFGPQPGNVIRNAVNAAGNCLIFCDNPPGQSDYCASEGTNQQYEWIQAMVLGSINNVSGNNGGYGDYTSQSTTLTPGDSYTITITPGFTGTAYTEYCGVWIDYNNDLDWDDAGELVATGSGNTTMALSFTVPPSVSPVTTRTRVSMQYSAVPPVCGSFTYGEVEDYTIVIEDPASCEDGVQNGDETGVDCGGVSCPVCPTCDDGIQNGDEEGVDCGGSCPNNCSNETELFGHYFENGWDDWFDGGEDCDRYYGVRSWEGSYSINLRDNSGLASSMTSPAVDLSPYKYVELEFYFFSSSMENGENLWVRYYDGVSYRNIAVLVSGMHFTNGNFWRATVTITNRQVRFLSNVHFLFQCDASDDNDNVYIDAVTLTGFKEKTGIPGIVVRKVEKNNNGSAGLISDKTETLTIVPNPATDMIHIQSERAVDEVKIISSEGIEITSFAADATLREIDISHLPPGMYILMVRHGDVWTPEKFVKM